MNERQAPNPPPADAKAPRGAPTPRKRRNRPVWIAALLVVITAALVLPAYRESIWQVIVYRAQRPEEGRDFAYLLKRHASFPGPDLVVPDQRCVPCESGDHGQCWNDRAIPGSSVLLVYYGLLIPNTFSCTCGHR